MPFFKTPLWLSAWLIPLAISVSTASDIANTDHIPQQLVQTSLASQPSALEQELLEQLYPANNTKPLWLDQNAPTPSALALLTELRNADKYGLRPNDYDGIRLTRLLTEIKNTPASQAQHLQIQADIALSTAALRFIQHLHYGRINPKQVEFDLPSRSPDELVLVATLIQLSTSQHISDDLQQLEPQFTHYQLLKSALNRYQQLAQQPELTQLPKLQSKVVKLGDTYAGIPALRRLLIAEQDLPSEAISSDEIGILDTTLVNGLKNYQTRHGLTVDGVLGQKTFKQLTTSFSVRIQQIELTLERWRWLPPPQSPMIVVNIPQFKLFAFKSNKDRESDLLRLEVIVGQPYEHTQTPVFFAEMQYVVIRPYWDVPLNITTRELLPQIRRNPDYINEHHFELVRGQTDQSPVVPATYTNINQLASGKIRLRQRPGKDNALGDIKFMLPNKYNVYLHSTPAQQLFNESRRAFSHGCIRVSNPLALAEYVLDNADSAWNIDQITAAMDGGDNQRINLIQPIPVMIVYGTAMPLESGVVQFFDDLYGHDAKLAALLQHSAITPH